MLCQRKDKFSGVFSQLWIMIIFCLFLENCLNREHLPVWERYGKEFPIEFAEIFGSKSENGFYMLLMHIFCNSVFVCS